MIGNKITHVAIHATILTILLVAPIVISDDRTPIPADQTQINQWFSTNVPHTFENGTLDAALATAGAGATVIKVRKDGSGDFSTVAAAINHIPSGNRKRVIVWIGAGIYKEKIKIDRSKPFVTLYGSPNAMPTLTYNGDAAHYGTVDSATLITEADDFMAANLIIVNSSPRPDGKRSGGQASALRVSGDRAAFYNCRMIGFQDTVCDDRGRHFFKNCYIEGTVDFIFGSAKSLYVETELHVLADSMRVITAQARDSDSEDTGYSFVHCKVTGIGTGAYLGRAWRTHPRVVFAYTSMSSVVNPQGWSDNFHPSSDKTVFFAEYQCSGPGSSPTGRAKFTKHLTSAQAQPFITLGFVGGSTWLRPPPTM